MIRFVIHQDIIPEKWDEVITQSLSPTVLACYEMLDVLTSGSTWHALIQDDYQAVMPLPVREKYRVHYIFSPFFLTHLGVFSQTPIDAQTLLSFFNAIPKKYKQADLLLNPFNDTSLLKNETVFLKSHQVSLQQPYDTLFSNFSQNTRRNIRDAQKQALTLVEDESLVEDIVLLFQNNKGHENTVHYGSSDYKILKRAAGLLLNKKRLVVLGVRDAKQKLIAGAFLVRDLGRDVFWFSGRDMEAAACKPMFYLIDAYLHLRAGQSATLDFNGSSDANVARLYKGFGGKPYDIPMIQHTSTFWKLPMRMYRLFR